MKTLGSVIFILSLVGMMAGQDAVPNCNCYYSSDCSSGNTCGGLGDCKANGKSDGKCSTNAASGDSGYGIIMGNKLPHGKLPTTQKEDSTALYAAVDGYFQAFLKAIKQGGGLPDKKLVAAAQKTQLSPVGHQDAEYTVWVALDAVMGWDFMYPNKLQRTSGYVGNIREVHGVKAAEGIVDATRRGLLSALQSRDASKVVQPLQEFWQANPNFIPRHLGRCYPHGHAEVTDTKSSVACQIDTLERLATMLIARTAPQNEKVSPVQGD
jgi:hypothetical protein